VTLPPRLPLAVRPARNEILASYLRRLATLNCLDGDQLWKRVTVPAAGSRRRPDAAAVAALTGRPPAALAAALPELRDPASAWPPLRNVPQPGCPRCDAGHPGGQVYRLLPHHEYACTRHRYWIGPPDISRPGPALPGLPEIITAQRRHLRLVRQHGWAPVHDGVLTGFMICGHLWRWQTPGAAGTRPAWEHRGQALIPPGRAAAQFSASRVFAAVYPEAVSLAEVLASPRWRTLATGTRTDIRMLADEIGRRVGIPACRPHPRDAEPAADQPGDFYWRPVNYFPPDFTGRPPSKLGTLSAQTQALLDRTAPRFQWDRHAGSIIVGHRCIQPVGARKRSALMEYISRASWQKKSSEPEKPQG
jgi:hypothetical protein